MRPVEPETYTCQTGCTHFATCAECVKCVCVCMCVTNEYRQYHLVVVLVLPHYSKRSQYAALHFSKPPHTTVYHSTSHHTTAYHSIPQYISPYYSISQYTTVHLSIPQYITVHLTIPQYITVHLTIPQYITVYDCTYLFAIPSFIK